MAGFFKQLLNKVSNRADIDWDELEADLIGADLGARTAMSIVDDLQAMGRKISGDDVVEVCKQHISGILKEDIAPLKPQADGSPTVILVVGVNGTGKTTSSAKLACLLKDQASPSSLDL